MFLRYVIAGPILTFLSRYKDSRGWTGFFWLGCAATRILYEKRVVVYQNYMVMN
jgi:hypothetical protein